MFVGAIVLLLGIAAAFVFANEDGVRVGYAKRLEINASQPSDENVDVSTLSPGERQRLQALVLQNARSIRDASDASWNRTFFAWLGVAAAAAALIGLLLFSLGWVISGFFAD